MMIFKKAKKFVNDPKAFVEDAIFNFKDEQKLQNKSDKVVAFAFRINHWKRDFIAKNYPEYEWYFVPFKKTVSDLDEKMKSYDKKIFVIWGYNELNGTSEYAKANNIPLFRMEDGFVRSVGLGSNHVLPMSLVLDKTGTLYFDSRSESGLEKILNEYDFKSDHKLKNDAERAINAIIDNKLSKYNNFNYKVIDKGVGSTSILVIGQVENDASILYGCKTPITNLELVKVAAEDNPDCEIIYRPHPDVVMGNRNDKGDIEKIRKIAKIESPENPLDNSLSICSKVYVITSLVGFEALLRGKDVTVLGVPFYAGWGLTNDKVSINRKRTISLVELFAGAYLLYPDYFDVKKQEKTNLFSVVDFLKKKKKQKIVLKDSDNKVVKIPAFAFHVGMKWRPAISEMLPEYDIEFVELHEKNELIRSHVKKNIEKKAEESKDLVFLVWGYLGPKNIESYARKIGVEVHRFEDGFVRSVGIGSSNTLDGGTNLPISITLDKKSIYYNCFKSSDIENLLNSYDFSSDNELMERASQGIDFIVDNKITKYNSTVSKTAQEVYGLKSKKRVLVLGQVETDASIKYGSKFQYTNNDLIKIASKENPDAEIIYKPHPAVLKGGKEEISNPINVTHYCRVITDDISFPEALETIDHVYVITSGSGFEALLRDIPVTCLGANFYSGWGITDDRFKITRRNRKLSKIEVFAAFYILYTRYYDHDKHMFISMEDAFQQILEKKRNEAGIEFASAAKANLDLGVFSEAEALYSKAIMVNPNFADWHAEKGRALMMQDKAEMALECYNRAVEIYDRMPDWYINLAVLKMLTNQRFAEVKKSFDLARFKTSNSRLCQYEYFKFLVDSRILKHEDAMTFTNKALASKRKKISELNLSFKSYWILGDPASALSVADEIIHYSQQKKLTSFGMTAIYDMFKANVSWQSDLLRSLYKVSCANDFLGGKTKVIVADSTQPINDRQSFLIRVGAPSNNRADLWVNDSPLVNCPTNMLITKPDVIFEDDHNWFEIYQEVTNRKRKYFVVMDSVYNSALLKSDVIYPDSWAILDELLANSDADVVFTKNALKEKNKSNLFLMSEAA